MSKFAVTFYIDAAEGFDTTEIEERVADSLNFTALEAVQRKNGDLVKTGITCHRENGYVLVDAVESNTVLAGA